MRGANNTDTIVAQATPPGRGGVSIVRVSGPATQAIAKDIIGFIPKPRYATFTEFKDQKKQTIDEGIALYFQGPNSFTGEDVLEFQLHGGPFVVDRLLQRVLCLDVRLANPGEFSYRAFLNNKIDLAQAEAIADLIHADSEQAARSAVRSLQGDFSRCIHTLLDQLIQLRKLVEASIDFPEEEIDFLSENHVQEKLHDLIGALEKVQASAKQGALLQEGMTVVIAGEPNAGKSSLLNCLSGKASAIVTDIAGTTRDILREYIHIDGLPLHVVDTAGLRETCDAIEEEGVRRARAAIENADLVLLMVDGFSVNVSACLEELAGVKKTLGLSDKLPVVLVKNKIDLTGEQPGEETIDGAVMLKLSAKEKSGIDLLKNYLKRHMGYQQSEEGVFIARRRHLDALAEVKQFLKNGETQLQQHHAGELLAEDLRLAQCALGKITGDFTSDDLLGEIFSSFCIGK